MTHLANSKTTYINGSYENLPSILPSVHPMVNNSNFLVVIGWSYDNNIYYSLCKNIGLKLLRSFI